MKNLEPRWWYITSSNCVAGPFSSEDDAIKAAQAVVEAGHPYVTVVRMVALVRAISEVTWSLYRPV
jgi:hypothetical protein